LVRTDPGEHVVPPSTCVGSFPSPGHRAESTFERRTYIGHPTRSRIRCDVEECIDAGDDRVFTSSRFTGRGRTSGVPADWHLAVIFTIRDGKVVRGEEYFDRDEALEAAGLRK
jgi:ketosteroid isomerase-like protein